VNETNGILVARNNPQALADAVLRMTVSNHEYFPAQIREKTCNIYSEKFVCGLMLEIYRRIVGR
jgi:hypothetical protein